MWFQSLKAHLLRYHPTAKATKELADKPKKDRASSSRPPSNPSRPPPADPRIASRAAAADLVRHPHRSVPQLGGQGSTRDSAERRTLSRQAGTSARSPTTPAVAELRRTAPRKLSPGSTTPKVQRTSAALKQLTASPSLKRCAPSSNASQHQSIRATSPPAGHAPTRSRASSATPLSRRE